MQQDNNAASPLTENLFVESLVQDVVLVLVIGMLMLLLKLKSVWRVLRRHAPTVERAAKAVQELEPNNGTSTHDIVRLNHEDIATLLRLAQEAETHHAAVDARLAGGDRRMGRIEASVERLSARFDAYLISQATKE